MSFIDGYAGRMAFMEEHSPKAAPKTKKDGKESTLAWICRIIGGSRSPSPVSGEGSINSGSPTASLDSPLLLDGSGDEGEGRGAALSLPKRLDVERPREDFSSETAYTWKRWAGENPARIAILKSHARGYLDLSFSAWKLAPTLESLGNFLDAYRATKELDVHLSADNQAYVEEKCSEILARLLARIERATTVGEFTGILLEVETALIQHGSLPKFSELKTAMLAKGFTLTTANTGTNLKKFNSLLSSLRNYGTHLTADQKEELRVLLQAQFDEVIRKIREGEISSFGEVFESPVVLFFQETLDKELPEDAVTILARAAEEAVAAASAGLTTFR